MHLVSAAGTAYDHLIEGNYFILGAAAATAAAPDIIVDMAGTSNLIINSNIFAHLIPVAGAARYITVADVRQGIICNNQFGGVQNTALTIGSGGTGVTCPNNVGIGQNYCNGALMARA
jgi:hypothetical protein